MTGKLKWAPAMLAVFLLLSLQGCPKPMAITIYNNSPNDLRIIFVDGQQGWRRHTMLRLRDDQLNRVEWIASSKGNQTMPTLDLLKGSTIDRYLLKPAYSLPAEYVTANGAIQMHLQLEKDGLLYAVKPAQKWPAPVPEQPDGFPIEPIHHAEARE